MDQQEERLGGRFGWKERITLLEGNLNRLLQLIAAADGRAGLVLALATAMLGVLAALLPAAREWDIVAAALSVTAAVGLLLCLLFLSFAAVPRTKGPTGSLVYFEGIAARTREAFARDWTCLCAKDYEADLAGQCYRNAEIARAKFAWLQRSLVAMYASIPFWAVVVFMLYLRRS